MEQPTDLNPYASPVEIERATVAALGGPEVLSRVATGLYLVYWGIGIILLSVVTALVAGALMPGLGGGPAMGMMVLLPAGIVVGVICGFVGRLFCLSVPPETRAREFIYGAVICDIIAFVGGVSAAFLGGAYISGIGNLISLLGSILFVLFLMRVSMFIGRDDLAGNARMLIGLGLAVIPLTILAGVTMFIQPMISGFLLLAVCVLALVLLLRYLRLLSNLRKAILAGR